VAHAAGVSRTTVSFVLNGRRDVKIPEETRRRVLNAAEQLGYHPHAPARQLAGGRSHILAFVLRQTPEQIAGDAVLAETLRGFAASARAEGFRVMVEPLPQAGPHASYTDLLRAQHADGLLVSGPRIDDPSLEALVRDGFPVILQGSLPDLAVPSVDVDNVAGARTAVEHLVALGHRRIACVTNAPLVYTAAQERLAGYRAAIAAAGLDDDPSLVAEGAFDAPSGHAAIATLLARTTFDAVFVASDVVALGAIGGLREADLRVPDDVSVVGFDDIPLAGYFDPPLTTVRLPAFALGEAAGRTLIERIHERAAPERTLLPTELVVRSSTRRRDGSATTTTDGRARPTDGGRRGAQRPASRGGGSAHRPTQGKE
jgi:LacI family transcriptional regulator